MKVIELKKINNFMIENEGALDYKALVKIRNEDIATVMQCIDDDNPNTLYLLYFLTWEIEEPDWKKRFSHLEGIEKFDIRGLLMNKIISASSHEISGEILHWFDFGDHTNDLTVFHTMVEWITYIGNICETIEYEHDTVISNIKFTLEKNQNPKDRCDLIKQVMEYSQRVDLKPIPLQKYYHGTLIDKYLKEILSLLIKGYHPEAVCSLFETWEKEIVIANQNIRNGLSDNSEITAINHSFMEFINYLKESYFSSTVRDSRSFVKLFMEMDRQSRRSVILLFKEMEEKENRELFNRCLSASHLDNENIQYYIRNILKEKNQNSSYVSALNYLWDNEIIERNFHSKDNIERIMIALSLTEEMDEDVWDMVTFLTDISHVEIIKNMKITEDNLDTRDIIYSEFPNFILKEPLSANQIENYADWLDKLSNLPADICQKVMNILKISIVSSMNLEEQKQFKELVLNPENFGSLDYIFQEYRKREQESFVSQAPKNLESTSELEPESEIKLKTVLELLSDGYRIDKVLDGFNNDDEITSKTLIRTYAYKNDTRK